MIGIQCSYTETQLEQKVLSENSLCPPVRYVIEAKSSHREGRAIILWQSEKNTEEKKTTTLPKNLFLVRWRLIPPFHYYVSHSELMTRASAGQAEVYDDFNLLLWRAWRQTIRLHHHSAHSQCSHWKKPWRRKLGEVMRKSNRWVRFHWVTKWWFLKSEPDQSESRLLGHRTLMD